MVYHVWPPKLIREIKKDHKTNINSSLFIFNKLNIVINKRLSNITDVQIIFLYEPLIFPNLI